MVGMMGPGLQEGPKMALSVGMAGALFIICKPGARAKAAYRTKRRPSQNFKTPSPPISDPFSSGMDSIVLLGPSSTNWSSKFWDGPPSHFLCFIFTFFLFVNLGPSQK